MLSKSAASFVLTLLACCSLPWSAESRNEVNLVFAWQHNQIMVDAEVDGRPGRFIVGSSQARSVLDQDFPGAREGPARLVLGQRMEFPISPAIADLGGLAAGILGADVWHGRTLVIDYPRQLVIISREPASSMNGPVYAFEGPPAIPIVVNGSKRQAILDSALPDTIVFPRTEGTGRAQARIQMADHDLGWVDVGFADTEQIRIGNGVLSKFLVKIDYRNGAIALWRDPRAASNADPSRLHRGTD